MSRLLLALVAAGCASANFEARPVEPRNPTRWTFDVPVEDARTLVLAAFCRAEERRWTAFQEPAAGEDIRLRAGVRGMAEIYFSPVYHNALGPCPALLAFRIRFLAPTPERTTVEVITEGSQIVAGERMGFPHGPSAIFKPVPPTSVEEYTILRRCGEALGVRDMPETRVPSDGVAAVVSLVAEKPQDATATLLFLGGKEVTKCLVAALERDGPEAEDVAYALGRLRSLDALPALERARTGSRHPAARDSAAEAIRSIRKPPKSVDDLLAQLRSKAKLDQLDAAIALVSTGREVDTARPVLEPFLTSDIPSERWRAAAALVRLRRLAPPKPPPD